MSSLRLNSLMCNKVIRLCPPKVPSSHIFPKAGPWNTVRVALLGRTGTSPGASLDSEQGIYHKVLQLGRSNIKLKYGTSWDMPTLVLDPRPPSTSCPASQPSSVGYSHFHTSLLPQLLPNLGRVVGRVTWVLWLYRPPSSSYTILSPLTQWESTSWRWLPPYQPPLSINCGKWKRWVPSSWVLRFWKLVEGT